MGSALISPAGSVAKPQPKLHLVHFSLHYLTSGGSKFADFHEKQITKSRAECLHFMQNLETLK